MVSPTSGSAIVFNGEIYNYVELGKELAGMGVAPAGGSDTGVLLAALDHFGPPAALARLNGMFAFGLWQPRQRRLLIARDRFGVKPLYYRLDTDGIAFASEPKALLSLSPQNRSLDRGNLMQFLAHNELLAGGNSFYEGIQLLPPGHFALYDTATRQLRLERYWDYPAAADTAPARSAAEACAEFDALFEDAVRIRLRSDVPVGITLSGGLDSTAVLVAASRHASNPMRCFTSIYGSDSGTAGDGELSWARIASGAVGAPLKPVPAPRGDWLRVMQQVVWHMDSPG
jgi:asparagine synthase (glutamine-hydrolysing)